MGSFKRYTFMMGTSLDEEEISHANYEIKFLKSNDDLVKFGSSTVCVVNPTCRKRMQRRRNVVDIIRMHSIGDMSHPASMRVVASLYSSVPLSQFCFGSNRGVDQIFWLKTLTSGGSHKRACQWASDILQGHLRNKSTWGNATYKCTLHQPHRIRISSRFAVLPSACLQTSSTCHCTQHSATIAALSRAATHCGNCLTLRFWVKWSKEPTSSKRQMVSSFICFTAVNQKRTLCARTGWAIMSPRGSATFMVLKLC